MKRILVVDDERAIVELVKYNLEQNDFLVQTATDGQHALQKIAHQEFDLVLLDLMLPQFNGLQVLEQLRAQHNQIPVILVTARDDAQTKVQGLNLGADDYITKPFNLSELIARINAILRRQSTTVSSDKLKLDRANFQVIVNHQAIALTKTEYKLFDYFYSNANHTLTREQLREHLWGTTADLDRDSRAIDIQVSHLRDKIEQNPKEPQYLQTIRGFGYRLTI